MTAVPTKASVSSRPIPTRPAGAITVNAAGVVLPDSARTECHQSVREPSHHAGTICGVGMDRHGADTVRCGQIHRSPPPSTWHSWPLATPTAVIPPRVTTGKTISSRRSGGFSRRGTQPVARALAPGGAGVKDVVENRLHALVCAGTICLATANGPKQYTWWAADQRQVRAALAATG